MFILYPAFEQNVKDEWMKLVELLATFSDEYEKLININTTMTAVANTCLKK